MLKTLKSPIAPLVRDSAAGQVRVVRPEKPARGPPPEMSRNSGGGLPSIASGDGGLRTVSSYASCLNFSVLSSSVKPQPSQAVPVFSIC